MFGILKEKLGLNWNLVKSNLGENPRPPSIYLTLKPQSLFSLVWAAVQNVEARSVRLHTSLPYCFAFAFASIQFSVSLLRFSTHVNQNFVCCFMDFSFGYWEIVWKEWWNVCSLRWCSFWFHNFITTQKYVFYETGILRIIFALGICFWLIW